MTTTSPDPTDAADATGSAPLTAEAALEVLRRRPAAIEALGGFGPLVLALALLVAMVLIVPSVAPERIVERPADATTPAGEAP